MLKVKNWEKYQHYKDRNPPWIKLYVATMSSTDWVALNDASRVLAVVCMMVGSKTSGQIDDSEAGLAYLERVAYLNSKPDLKPLIDCGFLVSASDMLATIPQMLDQRQRQRQRHIKKRQTKALGVSDKSPPPAGQVKGNGSAVAYIPLSDGSEYGVTAEQVLEFSKLYPGVDVPQTLNEIRGWNLSNPTRRKTARGVVRHINAWMAKEQNRG